MDDKTKTLIDDMSYESMLQLWRTAPAGHYMFKDDVGIYYQKVMTEKLKEVGGREHTRASKAIGWNQ